VRFVTRLLALLLTCLVLGDVATLITAQMHAVTIALLAESRSCGDPVRLSRRAEQRVVSAPRRRADSGAAPVSARRA
jgi:hypothetical protein